MGRLHCLLITALASLPLLVTVPVHADESTEETLLWSQRYASEFAAPEMFWTSTLDVYQIIWEAFEAQGWPITYNQAVRLARCESGLNPQAVGAAGEVGLFQFTTSTWSWASEGAGFAGHSRYSPVANASVAAWLMAHPELGGLRHWAACTWRL